MFETVVIWHAVDAVEVFLLSPYSCMSLLPGVVSWSAVLARRLILEFTGKAADESGGVVGDFVCSI